MAVTIEKSSSAQLISRGTAWRAFDACLRAHLDDRAYRFFSLQHNGARVQGCVQALLRHGSIDASWILDVGGGGFVLDFLLEQAGANRVACLDQHLGYAGLFHDLRRQGLLQRTDFLVADLRTCEFEAGSFNAVIAHDVLYEPALELEPLLPRFARWLKPGGVLYMDVWDRRARWLWQLTGRDMGFRRYDLGRVRQWLRAAGFQIMAETPYFGSASALARGLRGALWTCARLSNTRHFIGRLDTRVPLGDSA